MEHVFSCMALNVMCVLSFVRTEFIQCIYTMRGNMQLKLCIIKGCMHTYKMGFYTLYTMTSEPLTFRNPDQLCLKIYLVAE